MDKKRSIEDKLYAVSEGKFYSVRDLLASFFRHGAARVTDLHLKVGLAPIYRVDGKLKMTSATPLDPRTLMQLLECMLDEAELKTFEERRSVDSSFVVEGMQFRINCFHDRKGPALALRALDLKTPSIEDIGFPNRVWEDIVNLQQGLVLVTGSTGAGKSTTIAALLNHIAQTRPLHIITLEDPIEYLFESDIAMISQRAIGRDVPSYARGLRDCLREDPDVIFVGEMTDQESATWTLTAAETGHLVFSGLHTRDAAGTITRLLDMYPPTRHEEVANQLSHGLRYILAQKLLPRCDKPGRVVAMEILNNTFAVANLLRQIKPDQIYSLMQTQVADVPGQRMRTIEQSLAELVRKGMLAPHEAERAANHAATFADAMMA